MVVDRRYLTQETAEVETAETLPLSVVIPTYCRGQVLLATIEYMLAQCPAAHEIVVVDQTPSHDDSVESRLARWNAEKKIRWIRLGAPSIPTAMNEGLLAAGNEIVLFIDDDIETGPSLVDRHYRHYSDPEVYGVVGQILQPGQEPARVENGPRGDGLTRDLEFPFNGTRRCRIVNCMAGNLSVRRDKALEAGGMDLNFVGVAYRFETEFCRRLIRLSGQIVFDPEASISHLRAPSGGTRAYGDALRSASPYHGVGDYYYAIREGGSYCETLRYFAARLGKSLGRKAYLLEPWWLPVKLVGELRAMALAVRLGAGPQRLIRFDAEPHE